MDIKQIINEFRSLESTTHKDNTYNVISLFDMLHKLGASKERYPMFFIATNDAPNNIPNTDTGTFVSRIRHGVYYQ